MDLAPIGFMYVCVPLVEERNDNSFPELPTKFMVPCMVVVTPAGKVSVVACVVVLLVKP